MNFRLSDEFQGDFNRGAQSKGMFMQSADETSVSYWDVDSDGNINQTIITGASVLEREDPYWDFEKAILGSGDDFFIGTSEKDYIETGGGSDEIYAGVGGDVIVVQGEDVYASPNYSPATQTFTVRVQDGVYY